MLKALQYLLKRFGEFSTLVGIAVGVGLFALPVGIFVFLLVLALMALIVFPDFNLSDYVRKRFSK